MTPKTHIQTIIDNNTGEVLEQNSQTWIDEYPKEPDYVKLYIRAWCVFKDIKGVNTSFLYSLLPFMTYAKNDQVIYLNSELKYDIAKKLNWSEKYALDRFNKEIKKLLNTNILKKIGRGKFQVNPELIGKGEWKDIAKLRATFNLSNGKVTHEFA